MHISMPVVTTFEFMFILLHVQGISPGPIVKSNSSHLPRYFHPGNPACNHEPITREFPGNINWRKAVKACQLISELTVERLKPYGQFHVSLAVSVQQRYAVINVLPL